MHRWPRYSFTALVILCAATASAETPRHQGPTIGPDHAERSIALRRVRSQRFTPEEHISLAEPFKEAPSNTADFRRGIAVIPLRSRLSVLEHKINALRAEKLAAASDDAQRTAAEAIQFRSFGRRLRGMLKEHGKYRVAKPHKTFAEVTPETFSLFRDVMGQNVIWFAVNAKPGHLHTLLADQGDSDAFHHNTYGTKVDGAGITGNQTQFVFPVVLTDHEMKNQISYLNAGVQANADSNVGKKAVYSFFVGSQKITDIECTNWATSGPIGKLPRWLRQTESRLKKQLENGELNLPAAVAEKGLHQAMAEAGTKEARKALIDQVLANGNLTKWTRGSVKRVAREFRRQLDGTVPAGEQARPVLAELKTLLEGVDTENVRWQLRSTVRDSLSAVTTLENNLNNPNSTLSNTINYVARLPAELKRLKKELEKHSEDPVWTELAGKLEKPGAIVSRWYAPLAHRPPELVLRESLAKTLGLSRSQDPAKFTYDLFMSKKVPIVMVFNQVGAVEGRHGVVPFDADMQFNMEIMGIVDSDGNVIAGSYTGSGSDAPNAGALGVVPASRRPQVAVNTVNEEAN